MIFRIRKYLEEPVHIAPLVLFRIIFGAVMFISLVRFWLLGWIEKLYISPKFHFSFFDFVKPLGIHTYLVFLLCALAAFGVMLGFKYRLSAVLFFISFSYIELMDKAYYLNHYYFVALVGFLLIWLPAARLGSLDVGINPARIVTHVPRWCIGSIRMMLCIVYFYAGLAKLNSDWLIDALPLRIWLPSKYDLPIIGSFVDDLWMAYLFSWFGAIYDLSIWVFLLFTKTRKYAFPFVIAFHAATAIFFPAIGMFPYIMMLASLIFFDERVSLPALKLFGVKRTQTKVFVRKLFPSLYILLPFFVFQLLFPLRYLLYPGELFWTEEGYRFSWRVMLMEKAGIATFTVKDQASLRKVIVDNKDFLNPVQEKQMSFQPDMILQYAHFLAAHYRTKGFKDPAVFTDCYATLNSRPNQLLINPDVNLANEKDTFRHKTWITRFNDDIKGF